MTKLEIPITGKVLYATGDVRLWANIDLLLRDNSGAWQLETFRVDTGSELITFPAYDAKQLKLPIPQQPVAGAVHTQTGLPFRSGCLRFRIVGMDQTEYVSPCLFLGDPHTPISLSQSAAAVPRKLLQPFGLLDQLRFLIDRDPASQTVHGTLLVEKR